MTARPWGEERDEERQEIYFYFFLSFFLSSILSFSFYYLISCLFQPNTHILLHPKLRPKTSDGWIPGPWPSVSLWLRFNFGWKICVLGQRQREIYDDDESLAKERKRWDFTSYSTFLWGDQRFFSLRHQFPNTYSNRCSPLREFNKFWEKWWQAVSVQNMCLE